MGSEAAPLAPSWSTKDKGSPRGSLRVCCHTRPQVGNTLTGQSFRYFGLRLNSLARQTSSQLNRQGRTKPLQSQISTSPEFLLLGQGLQDIILRPSSEPWGL